MSDSLKVLRVKNGMTQKQLAEKLGVAEATISKWERGKSFPDVPKIDKLTEIFNVSFGGIDFYPLDTIKPYKELGEKMNIQQAS